MAESSFILPNWQAPSRVKAFSTTKIGGFSLPPYSSLNLGQHVGDDPAIVAKNRDLLPNSENIYWLKQTHSTICHLVDELVPHNNTGLEGDATISRQALQVCAVMTADCLPILLCDKHATTVAAVHAGWRGLADGIIQNTVKKMDLYPNRLMAWLGPAISQANFEVGADVKQRFAQFPQAFTASVKPNKYLADLYFIARQILLGLGIEDISGGEFCTYQDESLFFSHRRACHQLDPIQQDPSQQPLATTGRMVSAIYLTD